MDCNDASFLLKDGFNVLCALWQTCCVHCGAVLVTCDIEQYLLVSSLEVLADGFRDRLAPPACQILGPFHLLLIKSILGGHFQTVGLHHIQRTKRSVQRVDNPQVVLHVLQRRDRVDTCNIQALVSGT